MMVGGTMIKCKVMDVIVLFKAIITTGNFSMEKDVEMENIFIKMEIFTMGNGIMMLNKVMDRFL